MTRKVKVLSVSAIIVVAGLCTGLLLYTCTTPSSSMSSWCVFGAFATFMLVVACVGIRKIVKDIPGDLFGRDEEEK